MAEQVRFVQRAPGEWYAQVRRFWWLPWHWEDISQDGKLIERWDNPSDDWPGANIRWKRYQSRHGYPEWVFPKDFKHPE